MSAISMMRNRCTIRRNYTENVDGVVRSSWSDVSTNTRCLLQEKAGMVQNGPGGATLRYDAVCFLPFGTDIQPRGVSDDKDQLIMTSPAGATFLVNHVAERSGMANHLTAYLSRHQPPPDSV